MGETQLGGKPSVMSTRRTFIAQAGYFGLLLLSTGCQVSRTALYGNRSQCQRNLRSIEVAVKSYLDDNGGQRPKTLDDALSNIGFGDADKTARILRCPGAKGLSTGTDIGSRTGYFYVDWSKWFGPTNLLPASYPLIYDRSLQNHEGRGVNVVSVDGRISWDEGAQALRGFVAKHLEYQLPLPE